MQEFASPCHGAYQEVPVSTGSPFPPVIHSSDNAGTAMVYDLIVESLASHGYIVAVTNHTCNTWDELRFWPERYQDWTSVLPDRLQAISFLIDELDRMNAATSGRLSDAVSLRQIAVAGHSTGEDTALLIDSDRLARQTIGGQRTIRSTGQ